MEINQVPTTATILKTESSQSNEEKQASACFEAMSTYSSTFGDSACGEPLVPQHLFLDFTPGEEDTDYIQNKCCQFWDFIRDIPEIKAMKAIPENASKPPPPPPPSTPSCSEVCEGKDEQDKMGTQKNYDVNVEE